MTEQAKIDGRMRELRLPQVLLTRSQPPKEVVVDFFHVSRWKHAVVRSLYTTPEGCFQLCVRLVDALGDVAHVTCDLFSECLRAAHARAQAEWDLNSRIRLAKQTGKLRLSGAMLLSPCDESVSKLQRVMRKVKRKLPSLQELAVSNTPLHVTHALALIGQIRELNELRVLHIRECALDESALVYLCQQCPASVIELDISGPFGGQGIQQALDTLTKRNSSMRLRSLSIRSALHECRPDLWTPERQRRRRRAASNSHLNECTLKAVCDLMDAHVETLSTLRIVGSWRRCGKQDELLRRYYDAIAKAEISRLDIAFPFSCAELLRVAQTPSLLELSAVTPLDAHAYTSVLTQRVQHLLRNSHLAHVRMRKHPQVAPASVEEHERSFVHALLKARALPLEILDLSQHTSPAHLTATASIIQCETQRLLRENTAFVARLVRPSAATAEDEENQHVVTALLLPHCCDDVASVIAEYCLE